MMGRLLRSAVVANLVLLASAGPSAAAQGAAPGVPQETFDITRFEKRALTIGGHVELRPMAVLADRSSLVYRLRFPDGDNRWISQLNGQFLLDVGYRRGIFNLFTRSVLDGARSGGDWRAEAKSYEAWVSIEPSTSFAAGAGKRTLKWGKGYAWNPVAFLDRPKNPEDPALALEGFVVVSADIIRSFDGPLQTLAVTPVLVPVYDGVNESLGRTGHLHAAGKVYLLLFDTDIDVMFMSGGSRQARWGFDFSRNLRSDIEVHAEVAFSGDEPVTVIGPDGALAIERRGGAAWLAGIRYLAPTNTTLIAEYYRREAGFTGDEMNWYYDAVAAGLEAFESTGDLRELAGLSRLERSGYATRQPMQSYVFARASQPDAFGRLYLNAAATAIVNASDGSFSLMQEFQYRLLENLEVRSQAGVIAGARRTDFGERQGNLRLELRARYSF